ncbi:hypothetical protein ACWFR1_00490 [Streptomyces sp. NPDC055103]
MKLVLRDAASQQVFPIDPTRESITASVAPVGGFSAGTDVLLRLRAALDPHAEVYALLDQLDDTLPEDELRRYAEELGTVLLRLADVARGKDMPAAVIAALLELATEPLPSARGLMALLRRPPSARGLLTRRTAATIRVLDLVDP